MSHYCEEVYEVYNEIHPIARKPHTCAACKESISPGQRYTRCFILFDGDAETVIRCSRCQTIHEHLRKLGDGDMWPAEKLDCGQEYLEHWGKEAPPEIAALAFWRPGDPLPTKPLPQG
jgi:hypothetical protein